MKDVKINPRKKGHYKAACHKLMDEIWGTNPVGKRAAYIWLNYNFGEKFGRNIHFSTLEDEKLLREIWESLWSLSFKTEGFVGRVEKKKPKKAPPPKVEKKKKNIIASNVLELQRNHKTTIYRPSFWEKLKWRLTSLIKL